MVFTSRYLFSMQKWTIELEVDCRWAKPPSMQYGCHIWNICDIILNNMKLLLIHAETDVDLNLQEENSIETTEKP